MPRWKEATPERRAQRAAYMRDWNRRHKDVVKVRTAKWRASHPEQVAAAARAWRARNIEKSRAMQRKAHYKHRYGLDVAVLDAMRDKQGGVCAICHSPTRHVVLDHDHRTGKPRGWLCKPCNAMVGIALDNPKVFVAAAAYLRRAARGVT